MNLIQTIAARLLITLLLLSLLSPGHTETPSESTEQVMAQSAMEHAVKHTDPRYVCPMHPQIIRDEPGSCPICGMDLVQVNQDGEQPSGERRILYYRHPHDPTITSDIPRQDEMGMDFVPIYESGGVAVSISPSVVQNMGVRTAKVTRDRLWRRIDTVGYVDFDEGRVSHVHLRTDGWIEQLPVKSEGERVARGDVLFQLYSPTLVNAQEEYLQALSAGSKRLIEASRDRLQALGVSDNQIEQLKQSRRVRQRLSVYAAQDGIVAKLNVREGMYVKPATEVLTLADLSSVWLLAEVFEAQADWVRVGAPAEVQLPYLPGRTWEGKVEYIYPSLDPKTRTLKARLRFDNPGEQLKPNMFADVTIYGGARSNILVIPREALIRTGQQDRVILAQGEGRFLPREVTVGMEAGDWVEIMDGLREGDDVVTSGQFLIDSEASLKASILRLSDASSKLEPGDEVVMGTGVLRQLMPEQNKLNMAHDPIEALGWPSMVMDFDVGPDVSLQGLQPDDPVMFQLEKSDDGYRIKSIHKHAMDQ
jgi:Cu(I)/Ag(I) efflux system membrane fusion protein